MDRWSQLSMKDKSDLMSLYIQNGISSLEEIKKRYNNYQDGGKLTFQQWKAQMQSKYPDIEMDNDKAGYNYEEYFNNNYDAAIRQLDNLQHFPDTYKLSNHPTFSNESIYSRGPMIGGSWGYTRPWDNQWTGNEAFIPSAVNRQVYPDIYREDRPYTEEEIYSHRFDIGGKKDNPPHYLTPNYVDLPHESLFGFIQRQADNVRRLATEGQQKKESIRRIAEPELYPVQPIASTTRVVQPERYEPVEILPEGQDKELIKYSRRIANKPQVTIQQEDNSPKMSYETFKRMQEMNEAASTWGRSIGSVGDMTPEMVSKHPITMAALGLLGQGTAGVGSYLTETASPYILPALKSMFGAKNLAGLGIATGLATGIDQLISDNSSYRSLPDWANQTFFDGSPETEQVLEFLRPEYIFTPYTKNIGNNRFIKNFKYNRNINNQNEVLDLVWNNYKERESRPVGVYAHAKAYNDEHLIFPPEERFFTVNQSLNPLNYMFEGKGAPWPWHHGFKDEWKAGIKKFGKPGFNNERNEIQVNPILWFAEPERFRGFLGHEGQHSIQTLLPEHLRLAEESEKYAINNLGNKNTRKLLKPFERMSGEWEGSPDELDSEIIKWKLLHNVPLNTDFLNLNPKLKNRFIKYATNKFKLEDWEAYDILENLSQSQYFKLGGKLNGR